ncbi:MAG TPA: hypothetical protein VKU00_04505, partial [Chthonomonadaceae bacterium]|nr:hypothetical protein [Chthonomonadaceae bacterium]
MGGIIAGVISTCLSLLFWAFAIQFIARRVFKKENQKHLQATEQQQNEFLIQIAKREVETARRAAAAAEAACAAQRRADAVIAATLPAPGMPRTLSESVDIEAVETAAYAIIMQAHEEGWIEGDDFADRAADEARRSERDGVPAVAIAQQAAELRRRGGFGR